MNLLRLEPDLFLDEVDCHLFNEGNHQQLYDKLGAHCISDGEKTGTVFVLWAPNASDCAVIGDFNQWNDQSHPMKSVGQSGLWQLFVEGVGDNCKYKYSLWDQIGRQLPYKSDPYAQRSEGPPGNASVVFTSKYSWGDQQWMKSRTSSFDFDQPVSVYEVHLPSWRRGWDGSSLTYRELIDQLIPYVRDNGFTHIELLPVSDHPFAGSWGYQPIGLFSPLHSLGSPDELREFIDCCHQQGIGVIMDWVAAHFPSDPHGLAQFDGTHLYEHEDPRQGIHKEWNTCIFNYGRNEVKNYLISNALFWIREFHIDALRVDAVASMLYLDYSREEGEWVPNKYGGNKNLEAVEFLKHLNVWVHEAGAITIAEESTSWPGVTDPVESNGLGFSYKWNMGWMNDTLYYFSENPIHRKHSHHCLTFGLTYAYSENFVLPFSHDEVVYGKKSLISKMPGDEWQVYANLRLIFTYMFAYPGKKLIFMGSEIGQHTEWDHDSEVNWWELEKQENLQTLQVVKKLNSLYRQEPALHSGDCHELGFQWIDCDDADQSVVAFYRRVPNSHESVVCIFNFTPVVRENYRLGVYDPGQYAVIYNSDEAMYGGGDILQQREASTSDNIGSLRDRVDGDSGSDRFYVTEEIPAQGKPLSVDITLPPLAGVLLKIRQ